VVSGLASLMRPPLATAATIAEKDFGRARHRGVRQRRAAGARRAHHARGTRWRRHRTSSRASLGAVRARVPARRHTGDPRRAPPAARRRTRPGAHRGSTTWWSRSSAAPNGTTGAFRSATRRSGRPVTRSSASQRLP
jgi:hypothetical protein